MKKIYVNANIELLSITVKDVITVSPVDAEYTGTALPEGAIEFTPWSEG